MSELKLSNEQELLNLIGKLTVEYRAAKHEFDKKFSQMNARRDLLMIDLLKQCGYEGTLERIMEQHRNEPSIQVIMEFCMKKVPYPEKENEKKQEIEQKLRQLSSDMSYIIAGFIKPDDEEKQ